MLEMVAGQSDHIDRHMDHFLAGHSDRISSTNSSLQTRLTI